MSIEFTVPVENTAVYQNDEITIHCEVSTGEYSSKDFNYVCHCDSNIDTATYYNGFVYGLIGYYNKYFVKKSFPWIGFSDNFTFVLNMYGTSKVCQTIFVRNDKLYVIIRNYYSNNGEFTLLMVNDDDSLTHITALGSTHYFGKWCSVHQNTVVIPSDGGFIYSSNLLDWTYVNTKYNNVDFGVCSVTCNNGIFYFKQLDGMGNTLFGKFDGSYSVIKYIPSVDTDINVSDFFYWEGNLIYTAYINHIDMSPYKLNLETLVSTRIPYINYRGINVVGNNLYFMNQYSTFNTYNLANDTNYTQELTRSPFLSAASYYINIGDYWYLLYSGSVVYGKRIYSNYVFSFGDTIIQDSESRTFDYSINSNGYIGTRQYNIKCDAYDQSITNSFTIDWNKFYAIHATNTRGIEALRTRFYLGE